MFSSETGRITIRIPLDDFQTNYSKIIEEVNTEIAKGQKANALPQRREAYQEAYAKLCTAAQVHASLPKELLPTFTNLLYRIASDLYYNQEADGFKKSAYLMQLSFLMQMDFFGFKYSYPWHKSDTFQDLVSTLGHDQMVQFSEMKTYEQQISPLQLEKTLKDFSPECQKQLSDTLTRLIFSYQNITEYNAFTADNKSLQNNWQALTEAAIGNETPEQRGDFAELAYHRWPFLEKFNHENPNSKECKYAQVACYGPVLDLFEAAYGSASSTYLAKASQIQNMRGLFTLRIDSSLITEARGYFENAYDLRLQIEEPTDTEEKWQYDFLLNNIRTGLVYVLANSSNVSKEDCQKILFHSQAIRQFFMQNKLEGRTTAHDDSYMEAAQTAQEFFQKQEHLVLLLS